MGTGALAAGILAIALLGPIAGSLGASSGTIAALGTSAASGVASSLAATIGPAVLLGAIMAESEKSSIGDNVAADNSIKAFVLKSGIIKCLTEKGYSFDIYASLVLSDGANVETIEEDQAIQFFEIYGDLAVAEYETGHRTRGVRSGHGAGGDEVRGEIRDSSPGGPGTVYQSSSRRRSTATRPRHRPAQRAQGSNRPAGGIERANLEAEQ